MIGVFLIPPYSPKNSLTASPGIPRCESSERNSMEQFLTIAAITEATTTRTWNPDDRFDLNRNDSESAKAWEAYESSRSI
jgi:hypothetical protein